MRLVAAIACLLGACAGRPPASRAPAAPPPASAVIVAMSHGILEAFDHGELAQVKATLGDRYVHFEGSYVDRDKELDTLAHWKADGPHVGSRAWSDERVFARGNDAIFIGRAKERQSGNDVHGGYEFEGWYTLTWSREGAAWKLVYWGWQVAGAASQTATWNQIFEHGSGFNHDPNKLLVEFAAQHAAGTAVDVAMGQGRNALYLAAAGWKVTGVDISDEGVRQARTAAEARKLTTLEAIVSDVKTFDYGTDRFDLVAMIYAWPALGKIADLQRATKKGGLFVYEYFAPDGPADEAPQPGALAKQFSGWDILRDEIVDAVPDWAVDRAKIQRFVARKR